ncbi:cobalamin biosynthesis CobT family protein [Escherichia coli 3-267-03_S1_C2]|nr:cobalamin biosynthesis CobT family protein [Escherichia coli 3-267-03_S1_C2]
MPVRTVINYAHQKTNCFNNKEILMSKKTTKAVLKEVQDFRDCVKRVVAMLSGKQI